MIGVDGKQRVEGVSLNRARPTIKRQLVLVFDIKLRFYTLNLLTIRF